MTHRILSTLVVAAFVFAQPVLAETDDACPQNRPGVPQDQPASISGEPPASKAYLRMKNDSAKMIDAMQKNILLVEKRIELAKKKYTLVCVECMERELPWMNRQLETATQWNEILEEPGNTALDHLEAYWAIQDTHKTVRAMKENTDKYWRWKLDLE